MTVKRTSSVVFISSLAVLIGFFMMYWFCWAKGIERWLSLIGLVLVVLSSLALAVSVTRLLFSIEHDFGIKTLIDKHSFSQFKKAIGSKKAGSISNTFTLLCFLLVAVIMYLFFTATNKYQREQLDKFGQVQKVLIKDIRYRKGRSAYFDFYFDNQTLSTRLYSDRLKAGDSASIIFSTENPDIVKWLYDYKQWK